MMLNRWEAAKNRYSEKSLMLLLIWLICNVLCMFTNTAKPGTVFLNFILFFGDHEFATKQK